MSTTDRQADLAKIHIAKDELNLPEEHYRTLVAGVMADRGLGGPVSSASLDAPGRRQLLQTLREMGWSPQHRPEEEDDRWRGYWSVPDEPGRLTQAQADYIAKMAFELDMLPEEEDRLLGWIERQTGAGTGEGQALDRLIVGQKDDLLTRSQAHKVITGLQKITGRR
jgi:hypothetical protein